MTPQLALLRRNLDYRRSFRRSSLFWVKGEKGRREKGIRMPSPFTWFPRARVRYKPLDNSIIEMAEHTIIPTTVHEEDREVASDKRRYSHDMAGGDLDIAPLPRDQKLPNYQHEPRLFQYSRRQQRA